MNIEVLKSKTVLASVVLLVLSIMRVAMGDASALQGVQESVMSLIPIFLRMAIGEAVGAAAQGAEQGAAQGVREQVQAEKNAQPEPHWTAPEAGGG